MAKRIRRPKLTLEQVQAEFAKNGDKLLSKVYVGSKQRLQYVCHGCGTTRETCYNNYSRGYRCKYCLCKKQAASANPMRLTRLNLKDTIYSMTELCRVLNVDYTDFRKLTLDGFLPRGSQKFGAKLYYTTADLEKIKDMIVVTE